jgi:hypothetical protein
VFPAALAAIEFRSKIQDKPEIARLAAMVAASVDRDDRTEGKIGHAGIDAETRQQCIHLAAMMCLMIEEMGDEQSFRSGSLLPDACCKPRQVARQRRVVDVIGEALDMRVEALTLT